jgi:membrane complex biogenesis BtpA family protein
MLHLQPLPGSPRYDGSFSRVLQAAIHDLDVLMMGGADGAIIENFFDAPFYPGRVPPPTIAAMTAAATMLRTHSKEDFILGINVLRNDAVSALSIASVVGATFVRVNVHTGAAVADQGLLLGEAHESVRLRRQLGQPIAILADVGVKHSSPLGTQSLEDMAKDAVERGHADGILVTGTRTGSPVNPDTLIAVRSAVPDVPLLAASGVDAESAAYLIPHCDGVVVGTWLKQDGRIENPVDLNRVRQVKAALGKGEGEE